MKIKSNKEDYVFEYEGEFYKGNSIDDFLNQVLMVFNVYKSSDKYGNLHWECIYRVQHKQPVLMPVGLAHYSISKDDGYTKEEAIEDFKKLLFKRLNPIVYKRGKF